MLDSLGRPTPPPHRDGARADGPDPWPAGVCTPGGPGCCGRFVDCPPRVRSLLRGCVVGSTSRPVRGPFSRGADGLKLEPARTCRHRDGRRVRCGGPASGSASTPTRLRPGDVADGAARRASCHHHVVPGGSSRPADVWDAVRSTGAVVYKGSARHSREPAALLELVEAPGRGRGVTPEGTNCHGTGSRGPGLGLGAASRTVGGALGAAPGRRRARPARHPSTADASPRHRTTGGRGDVRVTTNTDRYRPVRR